MEECNGKTKIAFKVIKIILKDLNQNKDAPYSWIN